MTTKTEFPLHLLELFTFDIFGSQRKQEEKTFTTKGLIDQKELYQPILIHLKRLGNKFIEETKVFKEQMDSIRSEYFDKQEDGSLKLKEGVSAEDVNKKASELSQTKIELEHYAFQLEDFPFKGKEDVDTELELIRYPSVYEIIDFITKEKEGN